jgi:cytochrome c-type biogenesis protein
VEAKIPLAFVAGLLSFITPCVLPLVPGYLSAVSGAQPGVGGRRVVIASLPFVAGFSIVFVGLGTAIAAAGGHLGGDRRLVPQIAGIVIVVLGFAFMGLLPLPYLERLAAPGLIDRARGRGSRFLLGGAFAVCAAPCVGVMLASILALASDSSTVWKGAVLLAIYSFGLALPFLLVGIGFDRVLAASRWLRDHYASVRVASGAILVVIGLLLFFDRFWWLNSGVSRVRDFVGLG